MTLYPDGGPAIPVSVNTDRAIQGGTAIPVYGYASAPTDGRPAQAGAAMPVRVLTAADLVQNGGTWVLEGRTAAMPVYTAPVSSGVMGGPAIAVYPVNAWPPASTPAFVPTDIAGLQLWLKSDVGLFKDAAKAQPATADADAIYTWADQSGNGNDATQSTADNRPALKLNIQNGRAVVRFAGDNDNLGIGIGYPATFTLFVVTARADRSGWHVIIDPSAACMYYFNSANDNIYFCNVLFGAAGVSTLSWALHQGERYGTDAGNYRINGALLSNQASGLATTTDTSMTIGYTAGGSYLKGDIGEILMYNSQLSDANRAKVETYLNTRWALY